MVAKVAAVTISTYLTQGTVGRMPEAIAHRLTARGAEVRLVVTATVEVVAGLTSPDHWAIVVGQISAKLDAAEGAVAVVLPVGVVVTYLPFAGKAAVRVVMAVLPARRAVAVVASRGAPDLATRAFLAVLRDRRRAHGVAAVAARSLEVT